MNLHCQPPPTRADAGDLETAVRRVALSYQGIRDACVRRRTGRDGVARLVAYLVAPDPVPAAQERAILLALGDRWTGTELVRVTDLPRTAGGEIDEAALAALPVVGADLARTFESALGVPVRAVQRRALPPVVRITRLHDPDAPALILGAPLPAEPTARRVLADLLMHAAATAPDRGARFIDATDAVSDLAYPEMAGAALRRAGGLRAAGCAPGQTAIVVMRGAREAILDVWGAVLAGLVPAPLAAPARFDPSDQGARRVLDAAALFPGAPVIAPADVADGLRALLHGAGETDRDVLASDDLAKAAPIARPHRADPDDIAVHFLTSGSTARPKIVAQSHRHLLAFCLATCAHHGFTADEVSLNWLPLDHVGGLVMCHLRDLYLGCEQVHGSYQALLRDPLRWLDWCTRFGATVTWAPNFAFALVGAELRRGAERPWSLERLRIVFNGAEPISRRHAARFLGALSRHGLREDAIRPVWGMSETCSGVVVCTRFREDTLAGCGDAVSVGVPVPGLALRIVDEAGAVMREGETGRLQISGATVLARYVDNPQANAAAFSADGWFDTGDLATVEDGRMHIVGRDKDVVVVNGQKIDPASLEARIEEVEGVLASNTAVLARRDTGADVDTITVFFTPADPTAPPAPVVARIRAALASFAGMAPDEIVAVAANAVPKTSIGKIRKAALRQALVDGTLVDGTLVDGTLAAVYRRAPAAGAPTDGARPVTFWSRAWPARAARPDHADVSPVDVVALGADADGAAGLARALRADGARVRVLDPAAAGEAWASGDGAPRILVDLDGAADPIAPLMPLLAVLARRRTATRVVALGTSAQQVGTADRTDPRAAAVVALLRTAGLENPALRMRHVDCGDVASDLRAIIAREELADGAREPEVAYRSGMRVVSRLRKISPSGLGGASLTPKGRYVVVGGAGGIGALLCAHLLQALDAHVTIVGRRAEAALDGGAAERLAALRAIGGARLHYIAADIADPASLAAAGPALMAHGRPDGVFHLAATLRNAPLCDVTLAEVDAALATKGTGSAALVDFARREGIGLVVLFSSSNAYFGGAEVGVYAAAARAQEAVAHAAVAQAAVAQAAVNQAAVNHAAGGDGDGPIVRCASWSMWQDTGVSTGFAYADATRRSGFDVIPPAQALAALDAALSSPGAVTYLGLDETRPRMRAEIDGGVESVAELEAPAASGAMCDAFGVSIPWRVADAASRSAEIGGTTVSEPAAARVATDPIATAPTADRSGPGGGSLLEAIAAVWRDVLELGALPTGDDDVFALGGNSLMMPRIQERLAARLGIEIDLLDLFEHTSLGALVERVGASLDGAG